MSLSSPALRRPPCCELEKVSLLRCEPHMINEAVPVLIPPTAELMRQSWLNGRVPLLVLNWRERAGAHARGFPLL